MGKLGTWAANIGTMANCHSALLTMSFHVHSNNVMKCYLCFAGQVIRFMPRDIITVLPILFNPDCNANREFREVEEIKGYVEALEKGERFKDTQFEAFKTNIRCTV